MIEAIIVKGNMLPAGEIPDGREGWRYDMKYQEFCRHYDKICPSCSNYEKCMPLK